VCITTGGIRSSCWQPPLPRLSSRKISLAASNGEEKISVWDPLFLFVLLFDALKGTGARSTVRYWPALPHQTAQLRSEWYPVPAEFPVN
jgi:hypothetical protein